MKPPASRPRNSYSKSSGTKLSTKKAPRPKKEVPSQLSKAKMIPSSPSIASPTSPLLVIAAGDEAVGEGLTFDQDSTEGEGVTLTEFHLFPKLAPELRRMIWKFALPTGHNGERMIPVRVIFDLGLHSKGITKLKFTIDRNSEVMHHRCHDIYDLSLSATSRESRSAYLSSFSRKISLDKGLIRFSPETAIYLCHFSIFVFEEDFESILKDQIHGLGLLQGVEHIVLDEYLFLTDGIRQQMVRRNRPWAAPEITGLFFKFLLKFKKATCIWKSRYTFYKPGADVRAERELYVDEFRAEFDEYQKEHDVSALAPEILELE